MTVEFVNGDITEQDVDAIVNAANTSLWLGSGVAGAIRSKGGPAIQEECGRIGPIELGAAAITGAGRLKARYVIHAAAMDLGAGVSPQSCWSATVNSLRRAEEEHLTSIAFPAIGAGVGGLDLALCARNMLLAVRDFEPVSLQRVVMVLFGDYPFRVFEQTWKQITSKSSG